MKNTLYLVILALALIAVFAAPAHSQGVILRGGMNLSNAVNDPEIDDSNKESRLGFNAALLGDIPFSDIVHLQAGAGYEQKGMKLTTSDNEYLLSADYITIPILVSLRTPSATPGRASMRFFINLGVEPAFLVASDLDVGSFTVDLNDQARPFDFGLRGEAGIELPFSASGPGAILGLGYSYSLTDATENDDTEWHNYAFHAFLGLKLGL